MEFSSKIDVSNILTSMSIVVSAGALVYALMRDRSMRRRDYADHIRGAAATILARLERWKDVAASLYDDAQVAITDADSELVRGEDVGVVRDKLWREIVKCRAAITTRLMAEQVELAFAEVHGFDSRLHVLYQQAVAFLKAEEEQCYTELLEKTQEQVLLVGTFGKAPPPAKLGNRLRALTKMIRSNYYANANLIFERFKVEAEKVMTESDSNIYHRKISLASELIFVRSPLEKVRISNLDFEQLNNRSVRMALAGVYSYVCQQISDDRISFVDEEKAREGLILLDSESEEDQTN